MQVFKTYFKIVKKNMKHLSIYFFIFLVISMIITSQTTKDKADTNFSDTKRPIAIFNYDKNSEFSNNFVKFLSKYTEVIEIEDKTETIQDSLFFRKVEYIVKVPNGFTKEFKTNNDQAEIIKISIPDSTSSFYIDFLIEKYMNAARLYLNNIPDITDTQLNEYIERDLALETNLKIETFGATTDTNDAQYYYFYFFAYAIFSIIILGVTSIILSFNETEIKKRNMSSPIKLANYNSQIILASLLFTVISWAVICLASAVVFGGLSFDLNTLLLLVNSLILSLVVLSISFLLVNLLKNRSAIDAVANILSLGLCFISGVFVEQEYMSAEVLQVASFTPTYWYVKAINSIKVLTEFNMENISPIINYMLIQLIFGVAILAIALVIVKQKRASN